MTSISGSPLLSQQVTITADGLAALVQDMGLGELPAVLSPDPVWRDSERERAVVASAWRELDEVGLLGRRGRPLDTTVEALTVLTRPERDYTALIVTSGGRDAVVVAARDDHGIVARRHGAVIEVDAVHDGSLPHALLRRIPDAPPAPIPAVNVRLTAFAEFQDTAHLPYGDTSTTYEDTRTIASLTQWQPVGQGELSVARHDRLGRHQVSRPIHYQDYEIGRVLVVTDGEYLSLAPATKKVLLAKLLDAEPAD